MTRLAHFELGARIAAGTQGVVHRAVDTRSGAPVAIKIVPWSRAASAPEREELLERFKREMTVGGSVSHPGIAKVTEAGATSEGLWIAMELLEGTPLSEHAAPPHLLEPRRIARIVKAAADALAHVHERGIVHRDVTPSNLVLLPGEGVKVLDFGVARLEGSSLTQTGEFLGTPETISPEQIRGVRPGPPADQYALAATTFRLLTGHWPFEGRDPGEVFEAALAGEPPALRRHRPELPGALERCLSRGLAREPASRFPDIRAFAKALDESFSVETELAVPRPPMESVEPEDGTGTRIRAIAILLALLTIIAVVTWVPFRAEERLARRAERDATTAAAAAEDWRRRDPSSAAACLADGHVRFVRGDISGSAAAYADAFERDPRRAESDPRLSRNLRAMLDSEAARKSLIAMAPRLPASIEPELWAAARSDEYWRRWNGIRMLEARGHGARVDWTAAYIADLLHAGSCSTRKRAAQRLGEVGDRRAIEPLRQASRDARNRFCFFGSIPEESRRSIERRD